MSAFSIKYHIKYYKWRKDIPRRIIFLTCIIYDVLSKIDAASQRSWNLLNAHNSDDHTLNHNFQNDNLTITNQLRKRSSIGRAITRLFLKWEVWGSNLGPVKLDTLPPTLRHFFQRSCVARMRNDTEMSCVASTRNDTEMSCVASPRNDTEMGPGNSLHASA